MRVAAGVVRLERKATTRHALRIAGGIAVPFVVGEALGWSLPYIASILALQLLAGRQPPPTLAGALGAVIGIGIAFFAALLLTSVVLPYPIMFALGVGLAVFAGLYAQMRSASPFWFVLLIAITVTPLMAIHSGQLASSLAHAMIAAMVLAILAAWLMHALFPEPAPLLAQAASAPGGANSPRERTRDALIGTLVVMPLLLFLLIHQSAAVVAMITALSLLRGSGFAQGKRAALGLAVGNLIAGGVAILAYFVIDTVPALSILTAVIVVMALVFGERIATAGPSAPLYVAACTAAIVLIGSALSPFTDAKTAFATRVAYVVSASVYTLAMLALLEMFRRRYVNAPSHHDSNGGRSSVQLD